LFQSQTRSARSRSATTRNSNHRACIMAAGSRIGLPARSAENTINFDARRRSVGANASERKPGKSPLYRLSNADCLQRLADRGSGGRREPLPCSIVADVVVFTQHRLRQPCAIAPPQRMMTIGESLAAKTAGRVGNEARPLWQTRQRKTRLN
jgi:hypothetical protein